MMSFIGNMHSEISQLKEMWYISNSREGYWIPKEVEMSSMLWDINLKYRLNYK